MRLNSKALAAAIASAAELPAPNSLLDQLAVALSKGEGAARVSNSVLIVLRSPWDAFSPTDPDFEPTLLCGTLPTRAPARRFRRTREVVATLITYAMPGKRPLDKPHYAPASTHNARVPLGGVSLAKADRVTVTHRTREIVWYDLEAVPIGSFVYRVNLNGETILYQRVGPDRWILLRLQGSRDIVDLPQVLHQVCAGLPQTVDGLEDFHGDTVLLRTPTE